VLELAVTLARLLGVPAPPAARGEPLWSKGVSPLLVTRAVAVITARDEAAVIGQVIAGLPEELDVLVVDDGSADRTAEVARAAGARVVRHERNRGLGAALRTGLEIARDEGYDAAVYLDGDGEYDPRQAPRLLQPVLEGRADYVLGSRFLGERDGMSWHRTLANRASSALMGTLTGGRVVTDGQTGYRAFSRRALERFEISHDYNYAQVLTLALHQRGIDAVEVPIDYARRTTGRSFVRYGEYARRVIPAVWRQLRHSQASRPASATSTSEVAAISPGESVP
jgi:glycosyltransferase involved in cell wall biosynthesis